MVGHSHVVPEGLQMDERVEAFIRDAASDKGKNPNVVAQNTKRRLAVFVKRLRGDARSLEADVRERRFRAVLEARLVEAIDLNRGTATENHLQIVLRTLRHPELT
jgi:hypothetical protein